MAAEAGGRPVPFVRRVRARNFRSIPECDVALGPLTVLLGFNASGKSNFLDILRFTKDALTTSLAAAVASRGGLDAILYRSSAGQAGSFDIRLDLDLGHDSTIRYQFAIGRSATDDVSLVAYEELIDSSHHDAFSNVRRQSGQRLTLPLIGEDVLVAAQVDQGLEAMQFYDLDTTVLRELDDQPVRRPILGSRGEHLGPVLGYLNDVDAIGKERFDAYLSSLVPGARSVDERREGRYSTVQARFAGERGDETFLRESLSEGTLRAAGVLASLLQPPVFQGRIPLVGIEEPETALHPTGVSALYEALDDATARTQVIVTSQSSDLLDSEYANLDHIRAVANMDGVTRIGPIDAAGRAVVEKRLMTLSELHRSGQMRPEIPHPTGTAGTGSEP
jgi:predicted ATPase